MHGKGLSFNFVDITPQHIHRTSTLCILVQAEMLGLGGHDTDGVGVALSTAPTLHTNDWLALLEDLEVDGVLNAPLEAVVHILLPRGLVEVRLLLGVVEGVDTTVQVRVSGGACISADHDNRADGAVFGDQTSGVTTVVCSQWICSSGNMIGKLTKSSEPG